MWSNKILDNTLSDLYRGVYEGSPALMMLKYKLRVGKIPPMRINEVRNAIKYAERRARKHAVIQRQADKRRTRYMTPIHWRQHKKTVREMYAIHNEE